MGGGRLAPLSWISSFACALPYEAGLRDAMVLGKCEQSEQGAGRSEFTVLCTIVPRNRFHPMCYSERPILLSSQLSYVVSACVIDQISGTISTLLKTAIRVSLE